MSEVHSQALLAHFGYHLLELKPTLFFRYINELLEEVAVLAFRFRPPRDESRIVAHSGTTVRSRLLVKSEDLKLSRKDCCDRFRKSLIPSASVGYLPLGQNHIISAQVELVPLAGLPGPDARVWPVGQN